LDPLIKSLQWVIELMKFFSQLGAKPALMHQSVAVDFPTVEPVIGPLAGREMNERENKAS